MFTTAHIAQISKDDLSLKEGYRALTLPIGSFQGFSKTMKPGSFVDIYDTSTDSTWMLEKLKIIDLEGSQPDAGGNVPNASFRQRNIRFHLKFVKEQINACGEKS